MALIAMIVIRLDDQQREALRDRAERDARRGVASPGTSCSRPMPTAPGCGAISGPPRRDRRHATRCVGPTGQAGQRIQTPRDGEPVHGLRAVGGPSSRGGDGPQAKRRLRALHEATGRRALPRGPEDRDGLRQPQHPSPAAFYEAVEPAEPAAWPNASSGTTPRSTAVGSTWRRWN